MPTRGLKPLDNRRQTHATLLLTTGQFFLCQVLTSYKYTGLSAAFSSHCGAMVFRHNSAKLRIPHCRQAVKDQEEPDDGDISMKLKLMAAGAVAVMMSLPTVNAWAFDAASVPTQKQTKEKLYLGAEEVAGFLTSKNGKVLFIDVRTPAELMYVGNTPLMDANIPLKVGPTANFDDKKKALALEPNPKFVEQVTARLTAKSLSKTDPVVVMCRSGDRSAQAADKLAEAGFTQVYSVVDGFEGDLAKEGPNAGRRAVNGWKNKNQPWGYPLDKAKMTLEAK